jgi:hypothetical protein
MQLPKAKVCPYCAEKIKFDAVVCRYCGRDLQTSDIPKLPVSQVSERETTYFQEGRVTVTNARVIIGDHTYSLSNITSVSMKRISASYMGPLIIFLIGLGFIVCGLAADFNQGGVLWFFSSAVFIVFAIVLGYSQKDSYSVQIGSASGESNALISKDKDHIQEIVDAINTAIIERG